MPKISVGVGQRFRAVDAPSIVWEVLRVFDGRDHVRYAQIAKVGDPSRVKTLSCASLARREDYELVDIPTRNAG